MGVIAEGKVRKGGVNGPPKARRPEPPKGQWGGETKKESNPPSRIAKVTMPPTPSLEDFIDTDEWCLLRYGVTRFGLLEEYKISLMRIDNQLKGSNKEWSACSAIMDYDYGHSGEWYDADTPFGAMIGCINQIEAIAQYKRDHNCLCKIGYSCHWCRKDG